MNPPLQSQARSAVAWMTNQPYLLLTMCALFWAGNIIVARFAAGHVPPLTMNWVRWTGGFAVLLPFAWRHLQRDWPVIRANLPLIFVLAATGFALNNSLAYWALQYTEALNALLLQTSSPLFVALFVLILFRSRPTWALMIGMIICLAGVLVIILRGDFSTLATVHFNKGDVAFTLAMAVFGLYSALMTRAPAAVHPLSLFTVMVGVGAPLLIPGAIWEMSIGRMLTFDATTIWVLGFIVIFPSVLGYLFFNRGIELIGANRASPFLYLVPVFGSVMAIVFLNEEVRPFHVVGCALVLLGVSVAARQPAKVR